ncbi:unnamed protein product [Orchesella dallaii]|uniref:Uncharacterized protein n=1 Tax=Orchesella dallaii TaxID=48710 RepID=A0ABP1QLI1_9HEXA
MSSTGKSVVTSNEFLKEQVQENWIANDERSLKFIEKKLYLYQVMASVSTLKIQMLHEMLNCRENQKRGLDILLKVRDTVLSYASRKEYTEIVALYLAVKEKHVDVHTKCEDFSLKVKYFAQKKSAAWEEIQPALTTEINTADKLEKADKQLDHAIPKMEVMHKVFQLLKMKWDFINLKEKVDVLNQQTETLLPDWQPNYP